MLQIHICLVAIFDSWKGASDQLCLVAIFDSWKGASDQLKG